jgi:hypothetical protein
VKAQSPTKQSFWNAVRITSAIGVIACAFLLMLFWIRADPLPDASDQAMAADLVRVAPVAWTPAPPLAEAPEPRAPCRILVLQGYRYPRDSCAPCECEEAGAIQGPHPQ